MFYFLLLMLVINVLLMFFYFKGWQNYLIPLLFSYFIAIFFIILFISKDSYYYNLIQDYFYMPLFIWRWLFFINISKFSIIRIINISSIGILIISIYYAFSYYSLEWNKKVEKCFKGFIWTYCILQGIIYDPYTQFKLYNILYPKYLSVIGFRNIGQKVYFLTRTVNVLLVAISLVFLIYMIRFVPKLRLFRFYYFFMILSYGAISFLYIYFISAAPFFSLNISKIANSIRYHSFPLSSDALTYKAMPYFSIIATGVICYSGYTLSRLRNEMKHSEVTISKQIGASETTIKVFCHYVKNEVLAIEYLAEQLPDNPQTKGILQDIQSRCRGLFHRIDEIHNSTKTNKLCLRLYPLQTLIHETLDMFSHEFEGIELQRDFPDNPTLALVDPVYIRQAFHNIIKNSIDAMKSIPQDMRKLNLHIGLTNQWIQIEISDTGTGIEKENLDNIFLPFFSTHPYAKHWGVGLTLTYKIIHAHEGKITVSSLKDIGTTVRILLPRIGTADNQRNFPI